MSDADTSKTSQAGYSVILFHSSQSAIWTSRLLKKAGLYNKMIPVPRHLSSDCGYCVKIKTEHIPAVVQIVTSSGIEFQDFVPFNRAG
ncbi:MAG: DUF3343 domain-containing protein [Spirochaetes bacterium]|nr:DUF3343 domain-containing protein [Spirochaetota bacterium]